MKTEEQLSAEIDPLDSLLVALKAIKNMLGAAPENSIDRIQNINMEDAVYLNEFANNFTNACQRQACITEFDLALIQLIDEDKSALMQTFLQKHLQIKSMLKANVEQLHTLYHRYRRYFHLSKAPLANFEKKQEILKPEPVSTKENNNNNFNVPQITEISLTNFAQKQEMWSSAPISREENNNNNEEFNLKNYLQKTILKIQSLEFIDNIIDRENFEKELKKGHYAQLITTLTGICNELDDNEWMSEEIFNSVKDHLMTMMQTLDKEHVFLLSSALKQGIHKILNQAYSTIIIKYIPHEEEEASNYDRNTI